MEKNVPRESDARSAWKRTLSILCGSLLWYVSQIWRVTKLEIDCSFASNNTANLWICLKLLNILDNAHLFCIQEGRLGFLRKGELLAFTAPNTTWIGRCLHDVPENIEHFEVEWPEADEQALYVTFNPPLSTSSIHQASRGSLIGPITCLLVSGRMDPDLYDLLMKVGETEFQAQQPAALGSEQFPVFFAPVDDNDSLTDEDQYRNLCAHLNNAQHHICMVSPYSYLSHNLSHKRILETYNIFHFLYSWFIDICARMYLAFPQSRCVLLGLYFEIMFLSLIEYEFEFTKHIHPFILTPVTPPPKPVFDIQFSYLSLSVRRSKLYRLETRANRWWLMLDAWGLMVDGWWLMVH